MHPDALASRLWRAFQRTDPLIDELIAANAAKPSPGCETAKPEVWEALGRQRWRDALDARVRVRRRQADGLRVVGR